MRSINWNPSTNVNRLRGRPDISEKVAFLSLADSYPDPTASVEVVETHLSWVFLTDHYAYKLKKPVRGAAFDFSSLEARRHNCHHEIRLNRRLAQHVYLGIVALRIDNEDVWSIEGDGEAVEWLVQMRRLPRHRMLDRCIADGTVTPQEIDSVSHLLSSFYRQAPAAAWSGPHYCRHLADSVSQARMGLLEHPFGLSLPQINDVARNLAGFIDVHRAELIQRVRAGRVIDAHGDLRPEHICLVSPPIIFDCLEFNQDLRILDTASEMSFLTLECELMDCEYAGAAAIGQQLWENYVRRAGDQLSEELCRFYRDFHAFLRSSIAIAHLRDTVVRHPEKWEPKARRYLDAATKAS